MFLQYGVLFFLNIFVCEIWVWLVVSVGVVKNCMFGCGEELYVWCVIMYGKLGCGVVW